MPAGRLVPQPKELTGPQNAHLPPRSTPPARRPPPRRRQRRGRGLGAVCPGHAGRYAAGGSGNDRGHDRPQPTDPGRHPTADPPDRSADHDGEHRRRRYRPDTPGVIRFRTVVSHDKDGARRYRHRAEPARPAPVRARRHVGRRVVGHVRLDQRRTVDGHLPGRVTAGDGFAADLVARWWNGLRGVDRRDIWLTSDGRVWHVRARQGNADGREVHHDFDREYEARAMVDRLMEAAPGGWKDITKLVRKPTPRDEPGVTEATEEP
jgi:hypothetical protein